MKRKIKSILAVGIMVLTVTNAFTVFAAGVRETSKDSSVISISEGLTEFISQKKAEYKDEHTKGALTSVQVGKNTQVILANGGNIKIEDVKKTLYKNSSAMAIIDVKAGINAPIIIGSADVEIESNSSTNFENTQAKYVKVYEFNYNHPFYVNLDSVEEKAIINYDGNEIIFTNKSKSYTVNGETYLIKGSSPIIKKDCIFIPLKTLMDATGVWNVKS